MQYDFDTILDRRGRDALALETISHAPVITDMFNREAPWEVEHISLAKQADAFLIAPASANFLGKAANGIADDMLTTTILATRAPVLVAPAMNSAMYLHPAVQENMRRLAQRGYTFIQPESGHLACGEEGIGRLAEVDAIVDAAMKAMHPRRDLEGKRILVSAGPTQEAIDPVRYITNHSTGKMGYAIAKVCMQRGADVTLVTGPTSIEKPHFVNVVPITTAREMFEEVTGRAEEQDIIIKAAAVADYRPRYVSDEKVKKKDDDLALEMERTDDILAYLGAHKTKDQFLCGFSMETENMLENSRKKLKKKNLDMIIANSLKMEGAGFGGNTNVVTVITEDFEKELGKLTKEETADRILDQILAQRGEV